MKPIFQIIAVMAVTMAECAAVPALSGRAIIDVRDCGASPTNSAARNTEIIQVCIDSLQTGQTLLINEKYRIRGLYIDNKERIRISGKGCLVLSGAGPSAFIFELRNNIRDIQIDSLELIGENEKGVAFTGNRQDRDAYLKDHYATRADMSDAELESALRIIADNNSVQKSVYQQSAIGNYSGNSIHGVIFKNLFIHDINIGISLNADLGGEYSNALVISNKLINLPGAAPGQGYGIHLAGTVNCTIQANTIINTSRHAIYHAKTRGGMDSSTIIQDNVICDHRKSVALSRSLPRERGWIRAALEVTRSRSVLIMGNTFNACYDTCLNIARDGAGGFPCSNITAMNNKFNARQNDSPYINIGEQLALDNCPTENIAIVSNAFTASSAGYDVQILQGKNINFSHNIFSRKGVTGNVRFVRVGFGRYISASADIDRITFVRNRYSGPSGKPDTVVYDIDPKVGAGISAVNISKNSLKSIAHLWSCGDDNKITNPNLVLKP
ncbi:MAG: hypothetical protein ABIH24_09265 [Verrucomicrobiota bacterium]